MEKIDIPIIDLSVKKRHMLIDEMVKACEEFGFFKVINHGVSMEVVQKMEDACLSFFSLPSCEKEKEKEEFGYGIRNIGCNGDIGEVEYLLLHANVNSNDTSQRVTSTCHKDRRQYLRSSITNVYKINLPIIFIGNNSYLTIIMETILNVETYLEKYKI